MGIHYDYKSTKGNKLMEKQAKREKKLAEKKAKRLAKEGPKLDKEKEKVLDTISESIKYKLQIALSIFCVEIYKNNVALLQI